MPEDRVLLVTEANEQVASGHLLECAELARLLENAGIRVDVAVNDDACEAFKSRLGRAYLEYHEHVEKDFAFFTRLLHDVRYNIIVTNLREVHDSWLGHLKDTCRCPVVCIDEWGHRQLGCDVIINPMVDPYFWDYGGSTAKIYAGHEYLILPEMIAKYHTRDKLISEWIGRVCVSMGGVDKFGSTVKITRWLVENHPDMQVDVILGGGFSHNEELDAVIGGRDIIRRMQNVSDIYDYFEWADLAFCAGGNTLHELACIGTPALIVPTMDHEASNGKRFEAMGFGITLPKSEELTDADLSVGWGQISDKENRHGMMLAGKKACTGDGGRRCVAIVMGMF